MLWVYTVGSWLLCTSLHPYCTSTLGVADLTGWCWCFEDHYTNNALTSLSEEATTAFQCAFHLHSCRSTSQGHFQLLQEFNWPQEDSRGAGSVGNCYCFHLAALPFMFGSRPYTCRVVGAATRHYRKLWRWWHAPGLKFSRRSCDEWQLWWSL